MHVNYFCSNMNIIYEKVKPVRMVDRAVLFRVLQTDFMGSSVVGFVGWFYPLPHFGSGVGRPFGTSRPIHNTLACEFRKRPGSFLI